MKTKLFYLFIALIFSLQAHAIPKLDAFGFAAQNHGPNTLSVPNSWGTSVLFPMYSFTREYKQYAAELEDVNLEFQIVIKINGVEEKIGDMVTINNASFKNGVYTDRSVIPQLQIAVLNSTLLSGNIYLKFRYYDFKDQKWIEDKRSVVEYKTVLVLPPVITYPVYEGEMKRIRETGMIYFGMDAKWHHLQDANTLAGVFKKNPVITEISQAGFNEYYTSDKIGEPIGPNTRLVEDTNTGMTYYQQDGVLRYITSKDIANRYQFDLKKAKKMSGTQGYIIGGILQ